MNEKKEKRIDPCATVVNVPANLRATSYTTSVVSGLVFLTL